MMMIREIKKATKALSIRGDLSTRITGISIDSRTAKRGSAFIAIKGARYDGHEYIRAAIRKGAKAVIVSKRVACSDDIVVIRVKDTTRALGQIAAEHRKKFNIPIIAITGSTGKTTTKDMIAAVAGCRFKVLKNKGTENNQYGVPLTLLKLNASHEMAVLECGTNQPGDIRWLGKIVRPTIAVFTNIGESHLERLKSRGGVFREKVQLISHMDPRGLIIYNGNDPYLKDIKKKHGKQKLIRYGSGGKNDYQAGHVMVRSNHWLQFKVSGHIFTINSPAMHNIDNALAAISCGLACKIRYNDTIAALGRFKFRGARQEIKKIGQFWLIDDTYNANPISLKSAVGTLTALRVRGKRIVVCADMLELGARTKALHQSAGRMIAQSSANVVLTTGRYARYITQHINRSDSLIKAIHCTDLKGLQRELKKLCNPGDAILVKGSRGMHMEKVITFLTKHFKQP